MKKVMIFACDLIWTYVAWLYFYMLMLIDELMYVHSHVSWKGVLKHFTNFVRKLLCRSLFVHTVAGWLEKRLQQRGLSMNFARFFTIPILYNICEQLLLVLVRIGYLCPAANLLMFCIIACKSVFEVLWCSFQLILNWWAANQRTNVDNAMQVITEVYLDTQTPAGEYTGI